MIIKSDHPWQNFLYARRLVLEWLRKEGNSNTQIVRIMQMDEIQVELILMTEVEKWLKENTSPA